MTRRDPDDERMCETNEQGERLFSRAEIEPLKFEIGRRLHEAFGFSAIPAIVLRLRSTSRAIRDVIDGEELPSVEMLIGASKVTGVSIDWLLTDQGNKFLPASYNIETVRPVAPVRFPRDGRWTTTLAKSNF